jgi:serine/threonine protein kinase
VVKIIPKFRVSTATAQTRLQREIPILKHIDHPFIVKLYQVFDDDANYYLIQGYSENGNIRDVINWHGKLTEAQARASSFSFFRRWSICTTRCDIRCENILLDRRDNVG